MKAYIRDITYVLPEHIEENAKNRLTKKTGIYSRHICNINETASDLACKAAEKLFNKGIDRNKIEYLLFCTQSPDYFLPTTACTLQDKLGLSKNSGAIDINLGCSGYIYGLSIAKGLIESGQCKNVLFITSETYSKYIDLRDNSVVPLFGDGASATFLESVNTEVNGLEGFVFGTNGSGYNNLIVPAGGMRNRMYNTPVKEETDQYGNIRTNYNLYMNGAAISEFALEVVPKTVEDVLKKANLTKNDIDYFVFHQANKFMLEYLQMKCDLMGYPYWNDVRNYGNTVSSSIPIALCDMLETNADKNIDKVLSVGFGVGLSWGGCVMRLNKLTNKYMNLKDGV